jgi:hypothetical protein
MDDEEYHHMDKVISGLWIGDLHSATDRDTLTANNIRSILTMMRGRFSVPEVRPTLLLTSISNSFTSTTDLHPSANSVGRRGRRRFTPAPGPCDNIHTSRDRQRQGYSRALPGRIEWVSAHIRDYLWLQLVRCRSQCCCRSSIHYVFPECRPKYGNGSHPKGQAQHKVCSLCSELIFVQLAQPEPRVHDSTRNISSSLVQSLQT